MHVYYLPIADGENHFMVAAVNQKAACERLSCSVGYFRRYAGRRLDPQSGEAKIALSDPGRVWKQKYDYTGRNPQPWLYEGAAK